MRDTEEAVYRAMRRNERERSRRAIGCLLVILLAIGALMVAANWTQLVDRVNADHALVTAPVN